MKYFKPLLIIVLFPAFFIILNTGLKAQITHSVGIKIVDKCTTGCPAPDYVIYYATLQDKATPFFHFCEGNSGWVYINGQIPNGTYNLDITPCDDLQQAPYNLFIAVWAYDIYYNNWLLFRCY